MVKNSVSSQLRGHGHGHGHGPRDDDTDEMARIVTTRMMTTRMTTTGLTVDSAVMTTTQFQGADFDLVQSCLLAEATI